MLTFNKIIYFLATTDGFIREKTSMYNFTAKIKDQNANIIFRTNLFLAKSTVEQLGSIK